MRSISKGLSYVLHPSVMPLFGYYLVMQLDPVQYTGRAFLMGMILLMTGTYLIPGALSLFLVRMGVVSSLQMEQAEDRRVPYLIGAFFYGITAIMVQSLRFPAPIAVYLYAQCLLIVVGWLYLPYKKISAHAGGMAGLFALSLVLADRYQTNLLEVHLAALLGTGLIGSARLVLRAHTLNEVLLGAAYAFGVVLGVMKVLL